MHVLGKRGAYLVIEICKIRIYREVITCSRILVDVQPDLFWLQWDLYTQCFNEGGVHLLLIQFVVKHT